MIYPEQLCYTKGHQWVMDLFMRLTGVISELNQNTMKYPRLINKAPYETWMVKDGSL